MSSENTSDPCLDPASPYYLHPSDSNFVLVNVPFNGTGFNDWKRSVVISLSAKNKLSFVDGTITQPSTTASNFKAWDRVNSILISWFVKALDPTIARSVLYIPTAEAIWRNLEERFGQISSAQVYSLTEQLADIEQGNDSVATFFTKLKMLWDELDAANPLPVCSCSQCTCRITEKFLDLQEEQRLIQFLMKLNPKYKQVKASILMHQPLPPITHAYRLLLQEEKQKAIAEPEPPVEEMAFAFNRRWLNDSGENFNRGVGTSNAASRLGFGNNADNRGGNNRRSGVVCDYCNTPGHVRAKCYRLYGFPNSNAQESWKGKRVEAMVQEDQQKDDLAGKSFSDFPANLTKEQCRQVMDYMKQFNGLYAFMQHYNGQAADHDLAGEVKKFLESQMGIEPEEQRLFSRWTEKDDADLLLTAGLKDHTELFASEERKMEEARKKEEISKACGAVAEVRTEVDKLSQKVSSLEASVRSGTKVDEKEFIIATELLMAQLLKLDSIEAQGAARTQRKTEVLRVQGYVDALDALKTLNSNP